MDPNKAMDILLEISGLLFLRRRNRKVAATMEVFYSGAALSVSIRVRSKSRSKLVWRNPSARERVGMVPSPTSSSEDRGR